MPQILRLFFLLVVSFWFNKVFAQKVPILSYSLDQNKKARIEVKANIDKYYLLEVTHKDILPTSYFSSMKLGINGSLILNESVSAYPKDNYEVHEYSIDNPLDIDKDGFDDVVEFKNPVNQSPFNAAKQIEFKDGVVQISDNILFKKLSYKGNDIAKIDPHLADLEFLKFYIVGDKFENAQIYFMNSETHKLHETFKQATKINTVPGFGLVAAEMKGEIVYHPNVISPNGTLGVYRFEFEPNDNYVFAKVRMAFDLISSNMPFLNNNLAYYPMQDAAFPLYLKEKKLFDSSRIPVLLEDDIYKEIDYLALNQKEGYGLLREMNMYDIPSIRDIVIYRNLPNEMPRTGGIISVSPQTPLSHVNLRAIQDNVPNAYIKNALDIPAINRLIGKYVHLVVNQNEYLIEEVSKEKVNEWYEFMRPKTIQFPSNNLTFTKILPLKSINFSMADAFGAKCANVSEMRKFGFQNETIPDGFGIPFYFYQEFMKHNNLFAKIKIMMQDSGFVNNSSLRVQFLENFRHEIKNGTMPGWMLEELNEIQKKIGKSKSIRCRSSTNNEDLPDFGGAGLYDSKTHKISEGHISKTIKEIYASLWNFRAFEERDFFKIDNFSTSMGVLCHPNYKNEKLNGVAVSTDPLYYTKNTFYLNSQIGEDLVTNPFAFSTPEEILLDNQKRTHDNYTIMRYSSLSQSNVLLDEKYLNLLRNYISIIHTKFKKLYNATESESFSMEIEYKIAKDNTLVIKQARPWVGANTSPGNYVKEDEPLDVNNIAASFFPNPFFDNLNLKINLKLEGVVSLVVYTLGGDVILEKDLGYYTMGSHLIKINTNEMSSASNFLIAKVIIYDGNRKYETVEKIIKL